MAATILMCALIFTLGVVYGMMSRPPYAECPGVRQPAPPTEAQGADSDWPEVWAAQQRSREIGVL